MPMTDPIPSQQFNAEVLIRKEEIRQALANMYKTDKCEEDESCQKTNSQSS